MALARVQATSLGTSGATTVAVTFGTTPTLGNAVVVVSHYRHTTDTSCTDNYGNTYALAAHWTAGGGIATDIWVCSKITATGSSFTATVTGPAVQRSAVGLEISGVGSGLVVNQSAGGELIAAGTHTTATTAALTANEVFLIASIAIVGASGTFITVNTPTPAWTQDAEALSGLSGETDSRVLTSAAGTTQNASWTNDYGATYAAAGVVAFAASAPISKVNHTAGANFTSASGTTYASSALAVTAGNALVVIVGGLATAAQTVTGITDTAGNTYTKVDHAFEATDQDREEIWYAKNIIGHASNVVTVTWSAAIQYRGIFVVQYSGLDSVTPFEATAKGTAATGNTTVTTGTLTTARNGEVHLIVPRWGLTGTWLPAGFEELSADANVHVGQLYVNPPYVGTYSIVHSVSAGGKLALVAAFASASGTDYPGPPARVSQVVVEVASAPSASIARVSQALVEVMTLSISTLPAKVSQVVVEVAYLAGPGGGGGLGTGIWMGDSGGSIWVE